MLDGFYERLARTPEGKRGLAAARLRRGALNLLHRSLKSSGLTQAEVAKRLGIRRSAVNQVFRGDGNVRIDTLAEYLHAMGYEATLTLVEAGRPRQAALQGRAREASTNWANATAGRTTSSVSMIVQIKNASSDSSVGPRISEWRSPSVSPPLAGGH
ncbi:helix-turn-helix domain-containing protein [Actinomadura harenae]|uniref:XRE family transcriptional regulator n=1 Tax=Actinomadura harenae TaxID=2483351 RepID=A0A3M2MCN4_9ACTN|nr:helix-turn-helix transcriptional regulator [Actinomadura harenae]RMI47261.1 XRE family transcriptional regulator [Actinomadura harenae]